MKRLDQFLSVAARQMRIMPAALRDDELRELRGHLEQRAEDFENAGMSDDAAYARALESLGSPRALGAKLCDSWEGIAFSWWRLAAAIVGAIALQWLWSVANLLVYALTEKEPFVSLTEPLWSLMTWLHPLPAFATGWLFSRFLGRRGLLWATLYFGVLIYLGDPLHIELLLISSKMSHSLFMAWLPHIRVIAACAGAFVCQKLRVRALTKRQQESNINIGGANEAA